MVLQSPVIRAQVLQVAPITEFVIQQAFVRFNASALLTVLTLEQLFVIGVLATSRFVKQTVALHSVKQVRDA